MARLTMLKSSLATIKPRVHTMMQTRNPEAEQRTRGRKWMSIRARWFSNHPLCVECQRVGRVSVASQLDHIIPLIDGGKDDESNYKSLCKAHHDAKTEDEAKARGRC